MLELVGDKPIAEADSMLMRNDSMGALPWVRGGVDFFFRRPLPPVVMFISLSTRSSAVLCNETTTAFDL